MDNKHTSRFWLVLATLLVLLFLAAAVVALAQPAGYEVNTSLESTNAAYLGAVELEWAMPGEFTEPLPTPTPNPDPQAPLPPDLGEIDLGLELVQSGDTITGFVNLEFTLVFTRRHQVDAVWYGPRVEGTSDGTNLTLTSEIVSAVIAGKQVTRQFWLSGSAVPDGDGILTGKYRETVWGYGPQPFTVLGTYRLKEVVSNLPGESIYVYLPLVLRNTNGP